MKSTRAHALLCMAGLILETCTCRLLPYISGDVDLPPHALNRSAKPCITPMQPSLMQLPASFTPASPTAFTGERSLECASPSSLFITGRWCLLSFPPWQLGDSDESVPSISLSPVWNIGGCLRLLGYCQNSQEVAWPSDLRYWVQNLNLGVALTKSLKQTAQP